MLTKYWSQLDILRAIHFRSQISSVFKHNHLSSCFYQAGNFKQSCCVEIQVYPLFRTGCLQSSVHFRSNAIQFEDELRVVQDGRENAISRNRHFLVHAAEGSCVSEYWSSSQIMIGPLSQPLICFGSLPHLQSSPTNEGDVLPHWRATAREENDREAPLSLGSGYP